MGTTWYLSHTKTPPHERPASQRPSRAALGQRRAPAAAPVAANTGALSASKGHKAAQMVSSPTVATCMTRCPTCPTIRATASTATSGQMMRSRQTTTMMKRQPLSPPRALRVGAPVSRTSAWHVRPAFRCRFPPQADRPRTQLRHPPMQMTSSLMTTWNWRPTAF